MDDYSQWLGTLLRSSELSRNADWAKRVSELQRILRSSRKSGKKEEKSTYLSRWVEFKDLMLCADEFGEVEIIFEAVEALKDKLEKLERAKNSLMELERYGFGKDVVYVTYILEVQVCGRFFDGEAVLNGLACAKLYEGSCKFFD